MSLRDMALQASADAKEATRLQNEATKLLRTRERTEAARRWCIQVLGASPVSVEADDSPYHAVRILLEEDIRLLWYEDSRRLDSASYPQGPQPPCAILAEVNETSTSRVQPWVKAQPYARRIRSLVDLGAELEAYAKKQKR